MKTPITPRDELIELHTTCGYVYEFANGWVARDEDYNHVGCFGTCDAASNELVRIAIRKLAKEYKVTL